MRYFLRKNVIAIVLVILALAVAAWLWQQNQANPNNLQRVYLLSDFSSVAGKDGYQEQVDALNKSIEFLRQATSTVEKFEIYDNWNEVGLRKLSLEDYRGAVAAWEQAIGINEKSPLAFANIANVYKSFLQDYPKAENYYLQAISKNETSEPYFPDYEGLADLYSNYYTEKSSQVEVLMLSGLDKAQALQNRVTFMIYLVNYYKLRDVEKSDYYRQQVLAIDPSLESLLP